MKLRELARLLDCEVPSSDDAEVTAVTEDSRRVIPGAVFFAARGEHQDGHEFAVQAASAGAVAIAGDRGDAREIGGVPYLRVPVPRKSLGIAAHAVAGDPSRHMTVIGITGTNGKSSSAVLAHHVLESSGTATACLGTLGYEVAGERVPARHTTPFAEDLAAAFKQAFDAGQTHVVMEVSSHALEQDRVSGIEFDVAAFTNLTQDHLDYHGDMERYLRAKLKLFEELEGPGRFAVVNRDDANWEAFVHASKVGCWTYGSEGDCRAEDIRLSMDRTTFSAKTPWGEGRVEMHLLGRHNVSNALAVVAICGGLGVKLDRIAEAIGSLASVPGRFEHINAGQPFQVIVDYAHTEDGLRNVLQASRAICTGRIIAVFGCGGDRDKGKRPKMGAAAGELADLAIVTSDNPRTEDPERIVLDVEAGLQDIGKRRDGDYLMILDRAEAIARGIAEARPGDLVLIAGKGHEDYQILGTTRIPFDDREVARAVLQGQTGEA